MNISCGTNGKYGPTGTYGMHYGTAGCYSNDKYNTYGTAGTYMVVTAGSYLWLGTAD